MKIYQKLWEEFLTKDLSPLFPITCRYHGNIVLGTVVLVCVLHIYIQRHTFVREEVSDASFATDRLTTRTTDHALISIYTRLYTLCVGGLVSIIGD